jgi:hypothetical protein
LRPQRRFSPAEAKKGGFYGHHHHWHSHRFYGPGLVSYDYTGCYVKKWVGTPWGLQRRWVNICY